MKKLTLICFLILSICLMGDAQAQNKQAKMKTKPIAAAMNADSSPIPYQALYSSNFVMGDPANSRLILEMWKDFDDNAFERHEAMFADSTKIYMADGQVVKGKDGMMEGVKMYRNSLADVKSDVHAYMSFKSVDRNENWVAIWGVENNTMKDGKKVSVSLHEIWKFNKDGKIDEIRQYSAKVPPAQ